MKEKKAKKIAVILSIMLLFAAMPISRPLAVNAQAEQLVPTMVADDDIKFGQSFDLTISPMATHINMLSASLSIPASGLSNMTVMAQTYNESSIYLTVTLQRKVLLWWTDVVTFQHRGTGYLFTQNRYSISSPGTYRAKATATSNGETVTIYSGQVKTP